MATIFKAMGEPSRLDLLRQLMDHQSLTVGDLATRTNLSQANVSKHLKTLAQTGLIQSRKDKNFVFYAIAHPLVKEICGLCCQHLDIPKPAPKLKSQE